MATFKQFRRRGRWFGVFGVLAVVSTLVVGSAAYADTVVVDGDGAVPVSTALNPLNLGNRCVGSSQDFFVPVAIQRGSEAATDTARTFGNSAALTLQVTADSGTGSGEVSETMSGPGTDNAITLESNWTSLSFQTMSGDTGTMKVSLAPTTTGVKSVNVNVTATGPNAVGNNITRSNNNGFKVNWTGVNCTGTLVVNKLLANDPGKTGNKAVTDFTFNVTGPTPSTGNSFTAVGSPPPNGTKSLTVNTGSYTVTEDAENGYTPSYSNCTSVNVPAAGSATCTITNTFNGYASSTSSSLDSSSITIGESVTDTAEVTGDADGGDPGGSAKFYLCGPSAGPDPDCSVDTSNLIATDSTPTDAGTNKSSFSSDPYSPTAPGRYCFRAEYQGSGLYNGSSDYDSSECFTVVVVELSPVHAWIGLKNSDDQGTQFDLKAELYNGSDLVATGLTRCITGVTRNPSQAKEATVDFDEDYIPTPGSGDVLNLKLSTRIGTTDLGAKCPGPGGSHNNAVGLRLYFDSTSRLSSFDLDSVDQFLHSDGSACVNAESSVLPRVFNTTAPTATSAKCKDSASINFNGGGPGLNPWKEIGTWSKTMP